MLPKKKLFIPKPILAPKSVLLKKHDDGFAQEIFSKYNVLRNDLAAWFELFYKVDRIYEDYERADIGQLLINVRMQLQIQEESNKSGISILGYRALTNFKKQLENTVKTVYASAGHQSIKYLKEKLLKFNLPNSMLFENDFYSKSINPYHAFQGDLKNEFSLNFNAITAESSLGSILSFPTRFEINKNRKAINEYRRAVSDFYFKSINPYYAFLRDFKNKLSLNYNAIGAETNLWNIFSFPTRAEYGLGNVFSFPTRVGYGLGNIFSIPTRAEYGLGNIFSFLTRAKYGLGNVFSFPTRAGYGLGNVFSLPTRAEYGLGSIFSFLTRAGYGLGNIFNFPTRAEYDLGNTFSFLNGAESSWRNIFSFPTRAEYGSGSILSFSDRFEINKNRKVINEYRRAINDFYFKSINPYYAFLRNFKNEFSLNFNAITAVSGLGSVRIPYNSGLVIGGKNISSFYFKNMNDNSAIYPIVNINGADGSYSQISNYGENYASIMNMNPYNFRNYYHIYFPKLSSYIGSGFKMAYIQGESIKEFSSFIHDKIVSGLRHELPEVMRSAYRSGVFGVNRTKRKQKREMDSETKEFWHNMTYNIIQGFRKELESKTSYFFTNYIDKRAYGLSPFLENEDENEESAQGNWTSQETLTHNKQTSFAHLRERERTRITPHSIYNLKKTYPDIYNMLTFAGLLPTLYVQKHTRETAMGLLSKSIHQYYIGNRNLTVRAYDLLRNKLETGGKSFIWPEAMSNLTTMEFNNVRKAHRSSRYMEEIQALKTQVVNIEKQTLQSVQYSNVNVNGLVEKVYKEIEHRIKVDRVRRGY